MAARVVCGDSSSAGNKYFSVLWKARKSLESVLHPTA